MKKLFTILAAALFSVSMMADTDVFDQNDASGGKDMVKTSTTLPGTYINGQGGGNITGYTPNNKGIKLKVRTTTYKISDTNYGYVVLNVNSGYKVTGIKLEGTSNGKSNEVVLSGVYADVNIENIATVIPEATNHLASTTTFPNNATNYVSTSDLTFDATTNVVFVFDYAGSNSEMRAIITASYELLPATNPVTEVNIGGKNACYVGKTVTLTATTDVNATAYKWAVDGVDQAGADAASFNFTPAAAGTYSIVCSAKNANNADWVASAAHSVVATEKEVLTELVPVDGDITWDFNNIASATVAAEDAADTIIYWNLDAEWAASFASKKLAGCAQYHFNAGSYQCFQGTLLMFTTTVRGNVSVQYSNTGGSRPYRYVEVNGTRCAVGSASTDKITTEDIAVDAGDVFIKFYIPDATDPTERDNDIVGYTMGRVYKIVFTKGWPTAVDNTEDGTKAVKFIENGQMFIKKNGVVYNAQGAVVR